MFAETHVRVITVSKAEAVEVIIRALHSFADSEFVAGHDYEPAFRDAVLAIERRDVAALSAAIKSDGNAEDLLFPDGVNFDGVTLDESWIIEHLAVGVLTGLTATVQDRCRLLAAGVKLPRLDPDSSQLIEAALDAGITLAEQLAWTPFPRAIDDSHSTRAVLLVHPRSQLGDADLAAEFLRARDQKAAWLLLRRYLEPVEHLQREDAVAYKYISDRMEKTYAFILERAGLAYEYLQLDADRIVDFFENDDAGNPALPADEIFQNEIIRRIQSGSTAPFISLGTTDPDIAKIIADVNLAKSVMSSVVGNSTRQRKRNRGTGNSL